MRIKDVTIRLLKMKMKFNFTTSYGSMQEKEFLLLEAKNEDGLSGWGEGDAFSVPWYTEETVKTSMHMLEDFLIPAIINKDINHPDEVTEILRPFKRNHMAKAGIEGAVWDLFSKEKGIPLSQAIGGTKTKIDVGVSIGIQKSADELLQVIEQHLNEGYKRIKIKIKPGQDIEIIRHIRRHFPHVPLMADANSAYSLKDIDRLKEMDEFDLMMIEQPLAADDIIDHAKLQREISTPICLDESIHSYGDVKMAIELGSCKIINMKVGRVGGISEVKRIHDLCEKHQIPLWCGGMLEGGIGRAHNIALSSLPNFILPGDTSGSSRYWNKDIIEPEVIVRNGSILVPDRPGIGYEPDLQTIKQYTVLEKTLK
jgi:o-succinylbenzoate synthase